MKPHKHAELIKLWADGEIVQVSKLSSHNVWVDDENPTWCSSFNYRIKPKEYEMPMEDWKRVIDEGFYVKRTLTGIESKPSTVIETDQLEIMESFIQNCLDRKFTPVREIGLRQPHFQGDRHPEGDVIVIIKTDCGEYSDTMPAYDVWWDSVLEYIVLSEG